MVLQEAEEPFPPHLCCRTASRPRETGCSLHCLIPLPQQRTVISLPSPPEKSRAEIPSIPFLPPARSRR